MIARELISHTILPLRTSDTGEFALSIMNEFYVKHLPIVNNDQLLGLISEEDVFEHNVYEPVGSYNLSLNRPYVNSGDHLFDVMRVMSEFNLTVVPVIEEDDRYVGLITQEDLIQYYASSFSFAERGSIIVLEMAKSEYSLSTLSQIVESENGVVLSTFITSDPDSPRVLVTLKINKQDISSILAAFARYDYQVNATFTEADYYDTLKERYDMLMSYLNV
jgi:CBS domain-containing protein